MTELYRTGTGQAVFVHEKADCSGDFCVIHNPSDHCMRSFPTYWRQDRMLMERICPHGIGHPDPDDVAFAASIRSQDQIDYYAIHGCDGCCVEAIDKHLDNTLPDSLGG